MGDVRFDFSGRGVIVTGAAQGVGLALARFFGDAGARVAVVDVDGDGLAAACQGSLSGAVAVVGDVADAGTAAAAVERLAGGGSVDVVVNNAGVLRDGMLWKLTDEAWRTVLDVHLTGAFNFIRAAVPGMRERGYGRIVNVTSYSGLHGNLGQANYSAAKAGVIGLTRTAAKELARFGITVNAISPNAHTAMVESIPEPRRSEIAASIPMGRFGDPDEMAGAVGFLASEAAGYVTGVILPVDGGLSI